MASFGEPRRPRRSGASLPRRGDLRIAAPLLAPVDSIRVEPDDREGLERLCHYLVHPPIALDRLEVPGAGRACTYTGRRPHPMTGEQTVTLDPLEMLARLCQHIPTPRLHLTRQYGAYASRTRASRARRRTRTMGAFDTTAAGTLEPQPLTAFQRGRAARWDEKANLPCGVPLGPQ